jgi:hypothetical protein
MEMCMKEIGEMIKPTEQEYILIWTELPIKEIGLKISNMDMVLKPGLMVLDMKGIMNKVKNMEEEISTGQMEVNIMENF